MYNKDFFDKWASTYNDSVRKSDMSNTYPFAGYSKIQEKIHSLVRATKGAKVLEMGIGTGHMTKSLYDLGFDIVGVDFSSEMISKAKELMPSNKYINKDFISSLEDLENRHYDVIIFSYSIHHLKPINQKYLLDRLSENLSINGLIIIGDVITKTNSMMEELQKEYIDIWDDEEYYPTLEMYSNQVVKQSYDIKFIKVSDCSGILELTNKS